MSACVITGATGYIGSHLTQYLVDQGYELHALVREPSSMHGESPHPAVRIWPYCGRYQEVANVFRHLVHEPPIVIHFAAKVIYEHNSSILDDLISANITFGTQVLEAMQSYGSQFLINTGTYWQHNQEKYPRPNCLYAATKESFQVIVDYFCKNYSISTITLMLMDVYGPKDPRKKLFNQIQEHALTGKPIDLTHCEQQINLVHINDVVEAYQCASELLRTNTIIGHYKYYVAHEDTYILKDVIEMYQKRIGRQLRINWGAKPYRKTEIMHPYIGERLPNWKANIDLEHGLESLLL